MTDDERRAEKERRWAEANAAKKEPIQDRADRVAAGLDNAGTYMIYLLTFPIVGAFVFGVWGFIIGLVIGIALAANKASK